MSGALAPASAPVTKRISLPHVGALDGLRGAAVVGVLLYHGGHLKGGYLGVDLFFVLSGYLITSLLLAEWRTNNGVALGHFWGRRARRLLPAIVLVLLGVAIYCVAFADPAELARIRGDALATIGYFANWRAIFADQSYFDLFLAPSPLQHTWSLAIEEQFYVLWPLIFVGLAQWWNRNTAKAVLVTALIGGAGSTLLMVWLYRAADTNRAYYGTDTRSFALFAGIALAAAVCVWGFPIDRLARALIEITGVVSIVVLAIMWTTLDGQAPRLYRGGFTVAGIAAVLAIAAAAHPTRGPINRVLSFAPLRGLGLISYGLYLWHWPVNVVMTADRIGLSGWTLFTIRTGVALAFALASYHLIEMPIRHGALSTRQWRIAVPAIAAALVSVLVLTTSRAPTETAGNDSQLSRTKSGRNLVLFGDSLANSLRPGLETAGLRTGVWWAGGCRLIHGDLTFANPFGGDCPWESAFERSLSRNRPAQVILLIGAWDLFDVKPDGTSAFVAPGSAEWAAAFRRQLERMITRAERGGAHITVLTIPCMSPLVSAKLSGQPGAFDISRVQAANDVIREVVATHSDRVKIVDLFGFLCPGNQYANSVDGVDTRTDGVHLSAAGADLVAEWLLPQLNLPGRRTGQPTGTATATEDAAANSRHQMRLQRRRVEQLVTAAVPEYY